MFFQTSDGYQIELTDEDLDAYPLSLLSGLSRFYANDSTPVVLPYISRRNLDLLSAVYKQQSVPNRYLAETRDMYVFEDANGMEIDLLHYYMLDDIELHEQSVVDEADNNETITSFSFSDIEDDFVLQSAPSVSDDDIDEGTWT